MKNLIAFSILSLALYACGAQTETVTSNKMSTKTTSSNGIIASTASSFYIQEFSPASSTVTALPTNIKVAFTTQGLDPSSAGLAANYLMQCGTASYAAIAVSISSSNTVSVTLPNIAIGNGNTCVFTLSSRIVDSGGNALSGSRLASYYLSQNVWNEAATATYTASAGSSIGNAFLNKGADRLVLGGLSLRVSNYIDRMSGAWQTDFNPSTAIYDGTSYGTSTTGTNIGYVMCPANFRMTGVYGRASASIDAIGIVCKNIDQTQTYRSPVYGGSGGTAFELSCSSGQFATEIAGFSSTYLNKIQLGCR